MALKQFGNIEFANRAGARRLVYFCGYCDSCNSKFVLTREEIRSLQRRSGCGKENKNLWITLK